jgi:hypothetical protein
MTAMIKHQLFGNIETSDDVVKKEVVALEVLSK